METRAEVVHHTRGRIRVKVHGAKGNQRLLNEIKQSLAPKPGVKYVDVNTTTGSVVVHYDDRKHPDFHAALTEHGRDSALFALKPPELSEIDKIAEVIEREAEFLAAHSETARSIVEFVKVMDTSLKRATNNNLDLKVLLPLGLAVYAFVEVGAEVSTPLWVTLGIFSFNSFISLHPPVPSVSVQTQQVIRRREGRSTEARETRRNPRQP